MGPEDRVAVCENCKTCVANDKSIIKEHYLLPAHYSASEALERLVLWLKKQTGTDEELPVNLQILASNLSFLPFWNVQVKAATYYSGLGEDAVYSGTDGPNEFKHIDKILKTEEGSFDRIFSFTYPAAAEVPAQLQRLEFPTRAKKYFGQSYAKEYSGRVLNGRISQVEAEKRARSDAVTATTPLIMREIRKINARNDIGEVSSSYYLHVPVWDISYRVGGKDYRAFVDASTGRVLHATYPVSLEYRLGVGGAGVGHIGVAVVLALASVISPFLIPLAVGLASVGFGLSWAAFGPGRARESSR